ncbi:type I-C CRISPR-associated protein Cas8c/Csd1 [Tundrisphaera sp. TA3]|uniref:type I-C CRISPR-associated protein Cas8c/Csd1 n=1 Tax=Tundrisphaera sp. TA3 TaxID=3435775 RepID=UPI003EBFE33A
MSHPTGSPLRALVDYYERLASDPNQAVAEPGFSVQKVHFQVVLERDGRLHGFEDIRERDPRGKVIPRSLLVPDAGGRSGTGLKPSFCWDNSGYALGRDNKGNPARAAEMFAAFRDLHRSFREELGGDEGFAALCRFLEDWDPARAEQLPNWEEAAGLNLVFKVRGRPRYVHQGEAVREAWSRRAAIPDGPGVLGFSLLTGEEEEIARLHPLIKGVAGANTTGAAIVSFNNNAFESYGKTQGYNAPVGLRDVHRYTTALNRLLADRSRRTRIGDATVVFWAGREEGAGAEPIFHDLFDGGFVDESAEHLRTVHRVRHFLDAAREGKLRDQIQDPDTPFYILGLSPNVARLSVGFWLTGTVASFAGRLARHADSLQIGGQPRNGPSLSIRDIVAESVRKKDPSSRGDDPFSTRLAADIIRSILGGLPSFPETLLQAILRRIQADGTVSWRRASIIKAFLLKESQYSEGSNDVDLYLNKERPAKSYHCGRQLAVLAFAQKEALGDLNTGVVRRNMGSVMAMPGLTLGRLVKNAEIGHIPKLDGDLPEFIRDELKSISTRIQDDYPKYLPPREQGRFALGFYHEVQFLDFVGEQIKAKKGLSRRRYRTAQGEWVRSILEKKVADSLHRFKLPYLYEPRALLGGTERWPDFVVRRGVGRDLFVEVLGMNTPEYNESWLRKQAAYEQAGITVEGGVNGRLIILDFRTDPSEAQKFKYDERATFEALRPYLADQDIEPVTEKSESES